MFVIVRVIVLLAASIRFKLLNLRVLVPAPVHVGEQVTELVLLLE